jgi:hypothetical protein
MSYKKVILYINLAIGCIILQGCAYCKQYGPHMVNVPLMTGKNDIQLSVGASFPSRPALSLSAAYAPTDHFAMQVQGEYMFNNQYHTQLALGYYNKFANNTVIENYYGAEIGSMRDFPYYFATKDYKGNYAIGFTQINYGKIGLKAYGEVGGGLKIGYLYGEFAVPFYDATPQIIPYHNLVLEPTIFYRFGWEHFRIGLQVSGCYLPSLIKEYYLPLWGTSGIKYNYLTGGISFTYRF